MNQLEKLQQFTTLVADSGDIESMRRYQPKDAMATEKLAEGIRSFAVDQVKLEGVLKNPGVSVKCQGKNRIGDGKNRPS